MAINDHPTGASGPTRRAGTVRASSARVNGDDVLIPVATARALLRAALAEAGEDGHGTAELLANEDIDVAAVAGLEADLLAARSTVGRLRKREQELSALFSSACELVELSDVDVLLRRLVERAHDLIHPDITYITELDESTGELVVREALGSVTAAFPHARIPPGQGLVMKVASTRSAHLSDRYFEDYELAHDAVVDAIVDGEGIVSMAGVPMIAGDRCIGVLVAASRTPRCFSTEEVALVAAFANHATVALQNARLLDHARSAVSEAREACAQLTRHTKAMERAAALHTELAAVVLHGGGVEEVAALLARALQRGVLIIDRQCTRIAASGNCFLAEPLPTAVVSAIDESRRRGHMVQVREAGVSVAAVAARDSPRGAVILEDQPPALEGIDARSVERAAQIVALLTLSQEAVADAEERMRGELVADVLTADPVRWRDLSVRTHNRGVRLEKLRTPVVLVVAPEHRRAALYAANHTVAGCLAGEHNGALTALLPIEAPLEAASAVRNRIKEALPAPVLAVAGPAGNYKTLPTRFGLAQRCSRLLLALGREDLATCTDIFAPYLAIFGSGRDDVSGFIQHTIGPVIDWDRNRGTELLPTLLGFVETNASPAKTARSLTLHTNTVLQRLARVSSLLGDEWREPEQLFRIGIAVRLHQLAALL